MKDENMVEEKFKSSQRIVYVTGNSRWGRATGWG
jgi:hypothetical protein